MTTEGLSPTSAIQDSVREFRAAPWVTAILLIYLVPLFLLGLGGDFSSGHAPLPIDEDQLLQTVKSFLSQEVHYG